MAIESHAGYVLQGVRNFLYNRPVTLNWDDLLASLSCFKVESNVDLPCNKSDPIFNALKNIISRGLPTIASTFIESTFAEMFGWTEESPDNHIGDIHYPLCQSALQNKAIQDKLVRAFIIIDPRLNRSNHLEFNLQSWEQHPGSHNEEHFLYDILPSIIGEHVIQLIEPQRFIASMLKFTTRQRNLFNATLDGAVTNFYGQRVDFSVELPTAAANNVINKLVIEIDGPEHAQQQGLDTSRNNALWQQRWKTVRIENHQLGNLPANKKTEIVNFFNHSYAQNCERIYTNPLYKDADGLHALQIALSPFGVARVQAILVQLYLAGHLTIEKEWKLAVIERDVPCANLAIEDFKLWLNNLFVLEGADRKVPEIKIHVFNTKEFAGCELNAGKTNVELLSDTVGSFDADIIIDISMLQRHGFSSPSTAFINQCSNPNPVVITIRSAHSQNEFFKVAVDEPIVYRSVKSDSKNNDPEIVSSLEFLLRNIFRKRSFRPGQLDIISKALLRQNVIGLLPTGSGKSLCYQLTSLLQPSGTIVIDPLLSLMKDQMQNLSDAGFNHVRAINSELSTEQMEDALEEFTAGMYQFTFVSPERFQIQKFRDAFENLNDGNHFTVKQAVIDEAHCVSEWGFDFRPAYLSLGNLIRRYCGNDALIFGLTGTASFDVLSDVARELQIRSNDFDDLVNFNREELHFKIIPERNNRDQADSTKKFIHLVETIKSLPSQFGEDTLEEFFGLRNGKYQNCGIIFCPHSEIDRNDNSPFCVGTVASMLEDILNNSKQDGGYELGIKIDKYSGELTLKEREVIQNRFKSNESCILVSTNAFGMGIDKPNIRFIIHYSCPQSIEAYYQEAGRAGRDKNRAVCVSLFSDDKSFYQIANNGTKALINLAIADKDYQTFLEAESNGAEAIIYSQAVTDFNHDYILHPRNDIYFSTVNHYLSPKYNPNDGRTIPTPHFKKQSDAHRRIFFQKLNFPGHKVEQLIFRGVLQAIPPALLQNEGTCQIPFYINYISPTGSLTLDDRVNSPNPNGYVERGIYRLLILGIVRDYTKNYSSGNYQVELNPFDDIQIIENVKKYVGYYKSQSYKNQVEQLIRDFDVPDGYISILYKSIFYIIDFIYAEIERKRRNALREFIRVLRIGSHNISRFQDELDSYFNSRYLPFLRDNIEEYYIELLWEYISKVDNDLNSVRHLQGATSRLLITHDDNLLFQLLRSYALFMHPDFENSQAIEYFKAFEKSVANPVFNSPDRRIVTEWIIKFRSEIASRQPDSINDVDAGIVNFNSNWLRNFNTTLLGN